MRIFRVVLLSTVLLAAHVGWAAAEKPITILNPSGGELYSPGLGQTVVLDPKTLAKAIRIELSRDNGTTWELLGTIVNANRPKAQRNRLDWTPALPATNLAVLHAVSEDLKKPGQGTSHTFSIGDPSLDNSTPDGRYVLKAGDTMTGLLTLSGDPTANLNAATKQYVDGRIGTADSVTSSAGNSLTSALNDPATTNKINVNILTGTAPIDITGNAATATLATSVTDGSIVPSKVAVFPKASVTNDSAQSVATGAGTILTFDNEKFDTDAIHDTISNTSRLTCKTAGVYVVSGFGSFTSNSTGYRHIYIRRNGGGAITSDIRPAFNTSDTSVTTLFELNAGDFLELVVGQGSGVTLQCSALFMMARLP